MLRSAARMLGLALALSASPAFFAHAKPVRTDYHIDGVDPGVRLFVRQKMEEGNSRFTDDNIVLFVHGATAPSVCDFDLGFKDYSWADWMISKGYVVYLFDKRNYGYSSREKAMDEPAAKNKPVSRSYLVIRDIGAVVDHIRKKHGVNKVTLIGWSWGAMTAGYYTSLHSEKVNKLVMYAPAYSFTQHTNLGPGSGLQNKRKPFEFNYGVGAYRLASTAANTARWDGEIPVADKLQYREAGVAEAFWEECMASDPTSRTRTPPSLRAPNGVLEDTFMQLTGRPIWNASSLYVPVLVIAGEYDTWSYPEDREGLMRDLANAPVKKSVLIRKRDAPLGTYLGWNITAGPGDPGYDGRPFHAGQVCDYVGGMVPFFKKKADRLAAGDPRLSLEERYVTRAGYVAAVTAAANNAFNKGYLLAADRDALIAQAVASDVCNQPGDGGMCNPGP